MKIISSRILFVCVGLLFGYGIAHFQEQYSSNTRREIGEFRFGTSTSKLINPLLECELGEEYISKNSIKPFKKSVENKIDYFTDNGYISHVSYYFRDLNNGTWFGINEKEEFSPASLLKVPLLIHLLEHADQDPRLLNKEIKYTNNIINGAQHIVPEDPIKVGNTYTLGNLAEKMIIESDNNAAILIAQTLGEQEFKDFFSNLGLARPQSTDDYYINVRDYASFFRILFNASYLPHRSSEAALGLLTQTKFNEGIVAGVPDGIVIAHKFGERKAGDEEQLHDCGIVYYPRSPYLVCIMTRGENHEKLAAVISDLSRLTFSEVKKQK
jgi:beta-lactamase class A